MPEPARRNRQRPNMWTQFWDMNSGNGYGSGDGW